MVRRVSLRRTICRLTPEYLQAVAVSSINWSKTSLQQNREAGAIVFNAAITQCALAVFVYTYNSANLTQIFRRSVQLRLGAG